MKPKTPQAGSRAAFPVATTIGRAAPAIGGRAILATPYAAMPARTPTPATGVRAAVPVNATPHAGTRPVTPSGGARRVQRSTPHGGSRSVEAGQPVATLHAKTQEALMNATAKKVAALQDTAGSEVLVVYGGDHQAAVFCDEHSED